MKYENTPEVRLKDYSENEIQSYNNITMHTNLINKYLIKPWSNLQEKTRDLLTTVKEESPIMYWIALVILLIGVGCIFGVFLDNRTLMGVNVWIKPLKFSISIAIFLFTAGYLITKYPYSAKKRRIINRITAWTLFLEFIIIAGQASRGVKSHFNMASPLDSILFLLMGIFVGINVLVMVLFIIDTLRLKLDTTKAVQWAILLGWLSIFFGSWVGGQMLSQVGHTVGEADGGPGLPLVNWSTIAGDLRIAHFFALHGLQIIPLFAVGVSRKWHFSMRNSIILVTLFTLIFASCIGFIFWQAKQGIPLISQ